MNRRRLTTLVCVSTGCHPIESNKYPDQFAIGTVAEQKLSFNTRLYYDLLLVRNLRQWISQISRRIYFNESRMIVSGTRVYVSSNYFEGIHAQAPTFQIRVRHDITDDCKRQWRHAIIPNFSNYRFIPRRLRATGERRSKENKPGE